MLLAAIGAAGCAQAGPSDVEWTERDGGGSRYSPLPSSPDAALPPLPPVTPVGFNWGNAAKVYVLGWDQKNVSASDPTRPFRVAQRYNVRVMRVFVGIQPVVELWRSNPTLVRARFRHLLDDAQRHGVRLVLSSRLDRETVAALANRTYASDAEACRGVVTAGSSAWNGTQAFLRDMVLALGAHPGAYAWEVTNEPSWMLCLDSGATTADQIARFINAFQKTLKDAGARRVANGGSPFESMSDDQLRLAYEHTDLMDVHLYEGLVGTTLSTFESLIARVESLTGRRRDVLIGEYGTVSWTFFTDLSLTARERNWIALAWEFDGWDEYWFTDDHRVEVLEYIGAQND